MDKEFLFNYSGKPVHKGDVIINKYGVDTGWVVVAYLGTNKKSTRYVSVTHPDLGDAETSYAVIHNSKKYTGRKGKEAVRSLVYAAGQKIERRDGSCSGIIYLGEAPMRGKQRYVSVEFPNGVEAEVALGHIRSRPQRGSRRKSHPNVGYIRAYCGTIVRVSPEDHALVSQYNIHRDPRGVFLYGDGKGGVYKLANLIMSQYDKNLTGWVVSPEDGDHSNLRRENLIKETRTDMLVRFGACVDKESNTGEKYIHKTKQGTYHVRVIGTYLGTYGTIEEAIQVRDDYLNNQAGW